MPNWCSNNLNITGPQEDLNRFRDAAVGERPRYAKEGDFPHDMGGEEDDRHEVLSFHALVPIPEEILEAGYNGKNNALVQSGHGAETSLWGVKWGACGEVERYIDSTSLSYSFETAWGPPCRLIETVAPQYPTLRFHINYMEEGMCFKGDYVQKGDKVLLDQSSDIMYSDIVDMYGKDYADEYYDFGEEE
jgi:hypothetical protein